MSFNPDEYLPVAYRAWTGIRKETKSNRQDSKPRSRGKISEPISRIVVLDTETTTDPSQRFLFGFARETELKPVLFRSMVAENRKFERYAATTRREVIIYADDLEEKDADGYRTLMEYANSHDIKALSQAQFASEYLYTVCYKGSHNTALVGLNLSFDLSRIAYGYGESQALKGGFTLKMFPKRLACKPDCHAIHQHISKPCERDCSKKHRHIEPPCPSDCKSTHHVHTAECPVEMREHPLYGKFEISACEKKGKHVSPYCAVNCEKDHRHKLPPCEPGCVIEHRHYTESYFSDYDPTIRIKHIDSKKGFIRWGAPKDADPNKRNREGQFIDLRQLIFGMTNRAVSLASGCKLYGLPEEYSKSHTESYGKITPEFIDYARQDVKATEALAVRVLSEYRQQHYQATGLLPTAVYSPATIGKAYLQAMGITSMLDREDVPTDHSTLGKCAAAYYGARAEVHIRRQPMPVAVCDFTNMYGTVNMLMKLWDYQTASSIDLDVSAEELARIREVASDVAVKGTEVLLNQDLWSNLVGFAQIKPDGDILPVRALYGNDTYNVGVNVFHSVNPVWYTYADVLASALLTGKAPEIVKVIRFRPGPEKLDTLTPVMFNGNILIDPGNQDLFRYMIETRAAIKKRMKTKPLPTDDRDQEALKTFINAVSYGTYFEMTPDDEREPEEISVYGQYDNSWECTPATIEVAGQYCYPPIGAVITGAARLMLAVLERLVYDAGGTWVFGDTDSMAIVTMTDESLIPCPGGELTLEGTNAIRALSRETVKGIRETINRLNPYDRTKVPELLKDETEDANRDKQVYAFAISAKRYCLFYYDENGQPVIPPDFFDELGNFTGAATIDGKSNGKGAYMQHGLGLYLSPSDLDWTTKPGGTDNGHWMRQTWQYILDRAHGIQRPIPDWVGRPALIRYAVTSPHLQRSFNQWNEGRDYSGQIKPFNFLLRVGEIRNGFEHLNREITEASLMKATGSVKTKPKRLLAPYSRDPNQWVTFGWYDLDNPSQPPVQITANGDASKIKVKDHTRVLREYEYHPEIKSAMPDGRQCNRRYSGVLQRRIVRRAETTHIGKESNRLEESRAGVVPIDMEAFTYYPDWDRDLVRDAFGFLSNREITRLVNDESDALCEWLSEHMLGQKFRKGRREADKAIFLDIPESQDLFLEYGSPVKLDHMLIARYFRGVKIEYRNSAAIVRTAAKRIAPRMGIDPTAVCHAKGSRYIEPTRVLSMWREAGKPGLVSIELEIDWSPDD